MSLKLYNKGKLFKMADYGILICRLSKVVFRFSIP